jgi:hypothetical protein
MQSLSQFASSGTLAAFLYQRVSATPSHRQDHTYSGGRGGPRACFSIVKFSFPLDPFGAILL